MINNIIEKFRDNISKKSIQEILNIPIKKVLQITNKNENNNENNNEFLIMIPFISKKNDEIHVDIKFIHHYKPVYLHFLPPELNEIITSFMNDIIYLKFAISYPEQYPFISPYWSLDKYSCSFATNFNIMRYYQNKIDYHNQINQHLIGTPSIYPEKDILGFIVIINHFDEIFEIMRKDC